LVSNNRREPYRGTPQSAGDVISGQVQATARDGRHCAADATQGRLRGMLPAGVPLIPLCLDVRRGALDEFRSAIPAHEAKVAELARMGVDVINPSGAPPFMVLGHANEQELIRNWEATYETRIFTSGTSHIDALRALNVRRFLGATYFCGDITPQTARDRNAAATARPRRRGDRVNICCGA
jgi:hypothetical protein